MSIDIDKALPEYAQEIHNIEYNTFADAYSKQSILECTTGALYTTSVVAVSEEKVIGYIIATDVAGEAEIQRIAIDSQYRKNGYGAVLLEKYINNCIADGISCIHLEVRAGNIPAISLYEKFGFEQVGLRKGYYPDNGEDAVLYTLTLTEGI